MRRPSAPLDTRLKPIPAAFVVRLLTDHLAHDMHGRGLMRATHCSLFQASHGSRKVKFVRERTPTFTSIFCSARLATAVWAMHGRRARYGRQRSWSVHVELRLADLSWYLAAPRPLPSTYPCFNSPLHQKLSL